MQFFTSAVSTLQTLVVSLGAGLAVWGVINLLEGYGSDNPGAKTEGLSSLVHYGRKKKGHNYLSWKATSMNTFSL